MSSRTVLLAGGTGLVGRLALDLFLDDPRFSKVVALVRRPADRPANRRLEVRIVDFRRLDAEGAGLPVDAVACALGTTMAAAGSRERFREVDLEHPARLARLAASHGADRYVLVSALGASRWSPFYYSRVKASAEKAVRESGIPGVSILRPSLLLGDRAERRSGEAAAQRLSPLLPSRFRGVDAARVARVLVEEAAEPGRPGRSAADGKGEDAPGSSPRSGESGVRVLASAEIRRRGRELESKSGREKR